MNHDLILKRENGDKYNIIIDFYSESFKNTFSYKVCVLHQPKNKRKWIGIHDADDYTWRRLNPIDRKVYEMNLYLQHVTKEEILQAKMELWELLKPIL